MKIKSILFFIFFIFVGSCILPGQELTAIVKDSLTQKSIPFASIYLNSGTGVVANEEGRFRLIYDTLNENDSLFVSCMGFKTLGVPFSSVKDSIFYLNPKTI